MDLHPYNCSITHHGHSRGIFRSSNYPCESLSTHGSMYIWLHFVMGFPHPGSLHIRDYTVSYREVDIKAWICHCRCLSCRCLSYYPQTLMMMGMEPAHSHFASASWTSPTSSWPHSSTHCRCLSCYPQNLMTKGMGPPSSPFASASWTFLSFFLTSSSFKPSQPFFALN